MVGINAGPRFLNRDFASFSSGHGEAVKHELELRPRTFGEFFDEDHTGLAEATYLCSVCWAATCWDRPVGVVLLAACGASAHSLTNHKPQSKSLALWRTRRSRKAASARRRRRAPAVGRSVSRDPARGFRRFSRFRWTLRKVCPETTAIAPGRHARSTSTLNSAAWWPTGPLAPGWRPGVPKVPPIKYVLKFSFAPVPTSRTAKKEERGVGRRGPH